MEKLEMKVDDITEDKISDLVSFLDTWVLPNWCTESQLAVLYWRLRARWTKLETAEARIEKDRKKKRESYKWKILNQIQSWLEEIRNENWLAWHYEYEVVNIKKREDWRTLELWISDYDSTYDKPKRKKTILIEEVYNPEFFSEMLEKYAKDL